MSTFIYHVSGSKPFSSLLLIVFRLVLLRIIAAYLECAILSADVTIIIALEILFNPIGAVVELVLVYIAVLYHSSIDSSVGLF
jgi:hypothetical protein